MKFLNAINILVVLFMVFTLKPEALRCQEKVESPTKYTLGNQLEYINFFTDRDLYLAGESIWFTAQCLLEENHYPSLLSNVLYIELFNAGNKYFRHEKYALIAGRANGSFQIPEELPSGNYFMRAYTQYLRNFPPESFFNLSIVILNPETPLQQSGQNKHDSIVIQPEGMALIANFPARVGIKIPVKTMKIAEGFYVIDQNQKIIGKINPFPNGLAIFNFTPNDSTSYFLKTEFADEHSAIVDFPAVAKEGCSIKTKNTGSDLVCTIAFSPDSELINESYHFIVIHQGSEELYETEFYPAQTEQTIRIPFQNLHEGINYFVLKDKGNRIVQFQTLYLKLNDAIEIPIHLTKDTFTQRELIEIKLINPFIEFTDTARLTVSVIKHGTQTENEEVLSSRFVENPILIKPFILNRNIQNPDFMNQVEIALILKNNDSYKSIIQRLNKPNSPFIYLPEIRYATISGIVREKKTGIPASGVQVFVSVLFRNFQIHSTKSSDDGSFIFSLNYLTGMHDLFLYAQQNTEQELELFINNDFSNDYSALSDGFVPPDTSSKKLIEELWMNQQVIEGFNNESEILLAKNNELPFLFGDEMITVKPDDYIGLSTMKEVFNEIVPYVSLKETKGHFQFSVFNKESEMLFRDPLLLLDHIPIQNPDEIMNIHPSQVEYIGVITGVYVLGYNEFQGVISIKTKAGDFAGINIPAGSAFVEFQTLTPPSSPMFPQYNTEQSFRQHIPDFRTLLYWNPEVLLSSEVMDIKFYTSDHCSAYDVIVRGYTRTGKYCYGKSSIKVVKGEKEKKNGE